MGEFRFRTPHDWQLPNEVAATIHVVGLDGIPWPCKVNWSDTTLTVSRNRDESGRTYIGYQTEKFGRLMICTGSLLASHDYDLLVELARGTLNRVRNQISNWDEGGLTIEDGIHQKISTATKHLGTALMSANVGQRDDFARQSIDLALDAVFEVSRAFGEQVASYRQSHPEVNRFWIACTAPENPDLEGYFEQDTHIPQAKGIPSPVEQTQSKSDLAADMLDESFDHVRVSPDQLIGDRSQSVPRQVIVGPFLDVSPGGMSQSLIECDDFRARRSMVLNSMRNTIKLLPSNGSMLHLVSGINGLGHRHLNYAQQLQLTVEMLNLREELEIQAPAMVSFDFPWAERLAGAVGGIHPLQVADSLLRQGIQVSYIGLEMNLDYGTTGSAFRDPLQWIDLVDVWAQLSVPLVLCLRMPSGVSSEVPPQKGNLVCRPGEGMTDEQRIEMLQTVLPMMAARPMVAGLMWQQWNDEGDSRFPFGGLVTKEEVEKPILEMLRQLKQRI